MYEFQQKRITIITLLSGLDGRVHLLMDIYYVSNPPLPVTMMANESGQGRSLYCFHHLSTTRLT